MNDKMQHNHGLIIDFIQKENYVFGDGKLGAESVLVPEANWSGWLPDKEIQNLNGIEPYACVSFTILNCVEILERQEFGVSGNWSDRFLATISDTKEKKGNSPQDVAETLRKKGVVEEKEWPFDITINTFEKFYTDIPENLKTLALAFKAQYDFGHSYVPSNYYSLMEALKYSPVAFSVYAWVQDSDGLYYRPAGFTDGHFTTCYGYVRNRYWLIFDSYATGDSVFKKVRWDSLPMQAKRFTLHKQIVDNTAWGRFKTLLRKILGL